MAQKNLDWENIGFSYIKTDYRYVSNYKDGKWDDGQITEDSTIVMSEDAGVLHYAQECFEGLKAYRTEDNRIVCFRPDLNAERMVDSATRLEMPPFPKERFIKAVEEVVKANEDWVPPYGSGATLYIRPVMFATGNVIGVNPADEYQFRIFCTPVGPYFKGGAKPISIKVSDFDRAAPHGTGNIKAGLNYAMSLHPIVKAHEEGFAENLYLDAGTRTYVEETGGANIIFVDKDGNLVIPRSYTDSILPSVRPVKLEEVSSFVEMGLCGTAAVISPVGKITDHGKVYEIPSGMDEMGPVIKRLYDTLTGIQMGHIEGPAGWVHEIKK